MAGKNVGDITGVPRHMAGPPSKAAMLVDGVNPEDGDVPISVEIRGAGIAG